LILEGQKSSFCHKKSVGSRWFLNNSLGASTIPLVSMKNKLPPSFSLLLPLVAALAISGIFAPFFGIEEQYLF
jgi:hypothetical protein